jgi:hypothetical protein
MKTPPAALLTIAVVVGVPTPMNGAFVTTPVVNTAALFIVIVVTWPVNPLQTVPDGQHPTNVFDKTPHEYPVGQHLDYTLV